MANPTKKTEAAAALIVEILRGGSTRKAAHTAAGLSHQTFYEWLKEDEEFAQSVAEAEQDFITEAVQAIRMAGRRDWKALAWLLERKDPERFGTKIDLQAKNLTDEYLLSELAAVAERAGALGGGEAPGPDAPGPEAPAESRAPADAA